MAGEVRGRMICPVESEPYVVEGPITVNAEDPALPYFCKDYTVPVGSFAVIEDAKVWINRGRTTKIAVEKRLVRGIAGSVFATRAEAEAATILNDKEKAERGID